MSDRISRRTFLAASAAGLAVGCARVTTNTPKEPRALGVALLGLGNYAQSELAPGLQRARHCALRGIVTGTPEKIPPWQRAHAIPDSNVYDYASLPNIKNNPEIQVVYVVTPTALHKKFAIMAAEAGKHVWCEKPMALDVAECQSIIDACKLNGVSLAIGYRLHHEPNTQTITAWGKSKPYGAITRVSAVAGDATGDERTWRHSAALGGGALYDIGVYSINAIRYASGEYPVRVLSAKQSTTRPELFNEVDEVTEFELELPSGVRAYGKGSRAESINDLRIEAAKGSYGLAPFQSYSGVKGEASDGTKLDQKIDHQQAKQMDDEALAILEGRAPIVPGEEGLADIRIVNAIQESVRTGQPVTI
ncbi:MAG TPA: Gfo/Idh/MocA family oxidoreductase [Polyangiales bacterium]|nr:Gfo/Idh/MocA family oxidoreductase [Polyangiales bacterium]